MTSIASTLRSYLRALLATGRTRIAMVLAVGAATALTEGAAMLLLVPLLSAAVSGSPAEPGGLIAVARSIQDSLGVAGTLALWACIVIGYGALGAWRERETATIQQRFADSCRTRLFEAAAGMEWQAFVRNRSAHIVHALTALVGSVSLATARALQGTTQILVTFTYVAIALLVEPWGGVLVVVAGAILTAFQVPWLRYAVGHGRKEVSGGRAMHALISDHLAGMQMAKSWGAEARQVELFASSSAEIAALAVAAATSRARNLLVLRTIQVLLVAAGLWACLGWLGLSGPELLLIAAVPIRLLPVFVGLVQTVRSMAEMLPAWSELEASLVQYRAAAEPVASAGPEPGLSGPIVLRGVDFAWEPGSDAAAIAQVDLVVPERRTTALVGRSGAGKSTLAAVVLALLAPARGEIRVGDVPLAGAARRVWRSRSAYVPQDVFLLADTVRANLVWAAPEANEEAMWQALDSAAVGDVVRRLPHGLDTVVGDRGTQLSGGERQRLAIAQALLRRPELLVLDEATSHLDRDSEQRIQQSLRQLHGRVTILLIAHRLSTVRDADLIVVLDAGHVVEQGSWDALMARPGGALRWLVEPARSERAG